MHLTDIVVVVGGFSTQNGYLAKTGGHVIEPFLDPPDLIDNGDHLIQSCYDHRLFLATTNFCPKKRHWIAWRTVHFHGVGCILVEFPLVTGGSNQRLKIILIRTSEFRSCLGACFAFVNKKPLTRLTQDNVSRKIVSK